jgi:hypothetical protein
MTEEERRQSLKDRLDKLAKQIEKWKKGGGDNGTGKTN